MNRRQKQLLVLLLNATDFKSAEYFAEQLRCSERTIYNDLQEIDRYLQSLGFKLEKKPGNGTKLVVDNEDRLGILSKVNVNANLFNQYSTEKRQKLIALQLLYQNSHLSMQKLANDYFISKTAIAKDINKIDHYLQGFDLVLERNHQGLIVKGNEKNMRRAISALIAQALDENKNNAAEQKTSRMDRVTYQRLMQFFPAKMIEKVEQLIAALEKKYDFLINDLYYMNIVTHLLILIKRVQQGRHMHFSYPDDKPADPVVKKIAGAIMEQVDKTFALSITLTEATYIALYIFHCTDQRSSNLSESRTDNPQINAVIRQMIDSFSKVMGIDLRHDTQLENGLKLHIVPMLERLKYNLNFNNPMLMYLKSRYYSIFGMTWLITTFLENQFNVQLNDDEVGYITFHFLAAIERSIRNKPKRVVIVCYGGFGTSQFLANRLENTIPEIEVADVIPLSQLEDIDLQTIDFVVTTVPISFEQKPVVTISPILDEQDIVKINQYIFGLKRQIKDQTVHTKSRSALSQIIDPALIFTQEKPRSKQDILHYLCGTMHQKGYVDQHYEKTIFDREFRSPTAVGNGIAIPHGDEAHIKTPHIAVYTSKQPVDWVTENVSLIFLIAMKTTDNVDFRQALRELYHIFENKSLVKKLKKATDPIEFYQLIQKP
ncbi:BglG family transcription antiterminator [Scopulibacillus cellulosilyticus]|uniref:BglG family transcription antiterminator n=1 Tax=Scopulibacillus cellulosilyticus TaxID=2665665 RepID=A0ABW2Q1Q8_9BACL